MASSIFAGLRRGAQRARPGPPASTPNASRPPARGRRDRAALSATSESAGKPPSDAEIARNAARLFASGKQDDARALLERAVRSEQPAGEPLWLLLLALYEQTEKRALFDNLALDFAIRFERSAPSWQGPSPMHADLVPCSDDSPRVALRGKLTAASAPQLDRLLAMSEAKRDLRVDLSGLAGIDLAGCRLFHALLQSLRKRGVEANVSGEGALLAALAKGMRGGAWQAEPVPWLLHLELLQRRGLRTAFDEVAIAYATIFERSPPSFEHAESGRPVGSDPAPEGSGSAETLMASGEIEGDAGPFIAALHAFASGRAVVQVDLSGVRRIDFWAALRLLGAGTELKQKGKRLELLRPNALVAAWLEATGVTDVARIHRHRA